VTQVRFDYPANVSFTCNKCGLCCGDTTQKTRHILLIRSEAEKIAKIVNQPVKQFADPIEGKVPYIYEMHKKAEDGKCLFLQNNRCTIYSHRPLICRFYPFELSTSENGKYVFSVTLECPGVLCPDTLGVGMKMSANYFKTLFRLASILFNDEEI